MELTIIERQKLNEKILEISLIIRQEIELRCGYFIFENNAIEKNKINWEIEGF